MVYAAASTLELMAKGPELPVLTQGISSDGVFPNDEAIRTIAILTF